MFCSAHLRPEGKSGSYTPGQHVHGGAPVAPPGQPAAAKAAATEAAPKAAPPPLGPVQVFPGAEDEEDVVLDPAASGSGALASAQTFGRNVPAASSVGAPVAPTGLPVRAMRRSFFFENSLPPADNDPRDGY